MEAVVKLSSLVAVWALALSQVSPVVEQALTPLTEAIAEARAREAALPADATANERLEVALELDQAPLLAMHDIDLSGLSEADQAAARAEASARIEAINRETVATVVSLTPEEGWFSNQVFSQEAATGAFLVIQHSDVELQRRYLPALEAMANRGEALKWQYAMLYDRIAVAEGRLQRYGTQMHCVEGRMVPQPTEDPEQINERREPMGFRWPDYQAYLANFGSC